MADGIEDNPAALDQALRSVEAKLKRVADAVEEAGNSATLAARLKDLEGEKARLLEERAHVADKRRSSGLARTHHEAGGSDAEFCANEPGC